MSSPNGKKRKLEELLAHSCSLHEESGIEQLVEEQVKAAEERLYHRLHAALCQHLDAVLEGIFGLSRKQELAELKSDDDWLHHYIS